MIHYHGTPITPQTAALAALAGRHAFVSFADPRDLGLALDVCQSLAIDNGAFSAWRSGKPVTDWRRYYEWGGWLKRLPCVDWLVIPDVIDGSEADNDALLAEWPHGTAGVPVWHLHESIGRLERLAADWPRVALGSSGEFAQLKTPRWWSRMAEVFNLLCDRDGRSCVKVHGLRMLDPDVFMRFPFASADSTNIAQNIGIDSAWRGTYQPPTKEARARLMAERIESHQAPLLWQAQPAQAALFGDAA